MTNWKTHLVILLFLTTLCNVTELFSPSKKGEFEWYIPTCAAIFLFIIVETFMWVVWLIGGRG